MGESGESVKTAVLALMKLLKKGTPVSIQHMANEALGKINNPESYPTLVPQFRPNKKKSRVSPKAY